MARDTQSADNSSKIMSTRRLISLLAVCLAIPSALVIGCGGGGTTSSSNGGGSCSLSAFLPNYAADIDGGSDLRRWDRLPLTIFRKDLSGWSSQDTIAFNAGTNAWRSVSGNVVDFSIVSSETGANITVEFVDRNVVKDDAVGLTTISFIGSRIIEATVQVANRNANGTPRSQTELNKIVVHEIGHALGIGGHSSKNTDIMFAFVAPTSPNTPTISDWNTVRTAYCDEFAATRGPLAPLEGPVQKLEISCPGHQDH